MRRLIIICLLLSLLGAAAVTYWSVADDPTLSDMELLRLAGTVEVVRGGETIEVGDKLGIRPGDQIATYGDESGARLRLQGDREIELGADSGLTVTGATAVTGRAGSFLADAGEPTTVAFGDVEASTSDGLFRVDVGYGSARAGVYQGSATLSAPEQADTEVHPLFQASVAGTFVSSPGPLKVSASDPWDLIHVADVLELDEQLERLGRGLDTQLGKDRPGLPYFAALAERPRVGFIRNYLNRSVPDLLIGVSIADSTPSSFERTFERAFSLFDEGGQWGVVAAILGAREGPLVTQLKDVILSTRVALGGNRLRFTVAVAGDVGGRGKGEGRRGGSGGSSTGGNRTAGDDSSTEGSTGPVTGSVDNPPSSSGGTSTGGGTGSDGGATGGSTGGSTGGATGGGGDGGGGDGRGTSGGGDGGGGDGRGTSGGGDGGGGDGGGDGGGGDGGGGDGGGGDGGGGDGGGGDGGGGDGGDECDPLQDPTCIIPPLPVPTPTGILP